MSCVLISYRRSDAADIAPRIAAWLSARMTPNAVRTDVDTIQYGKDGQCALADRVSAADVVLVIIGTRWLAVSSDPGQRRLDDPVDVVRLEIEQALRLQKPIIPLLVHDASMPDVAAVPPTMAAFCDAQAATVRSDRMFHSDMLAVAEAISKVAPAVRIDTELDVMPGAIRTDCPVCGKNDRAQKLSTRELFALRPPMPAWSPLPMNEAPIPIKSNAQIVAEALWPSLGLAAVRALLLLIIIVLANVVVQQVSAQAFSLYTHGAVVSAVAGGFIVVVTLVELVLRIRSRVKQRTADREVNQQNQGIDQQNQQINQQNQEIEQRNWTIDQHNREIEETRHALWEQMYACSRDGVVYLPGAMSHCSTSEELYQQEHLGYVAFAPYV